MDGAQALFAANVETKFGTNGIKLLKTNRYPLESDQVWAERTGEFKLDFSKKDENSFIDEIDDSTAEVVYPTAELICDDLKGIEGYVYEDGLVELTLAQNNTVDIKSAIDDRIITDAIKRDKSLFALFIICFHPHFRFL